MARAMGSAQVPATDGPERSLDAEMRAPSTTIPDVVVLDFVEDDTKAKEIADPKKDLWLSSVDGLVISDPTCAELFWHFGAL